MTSIRTLLVDVSPDFLEAATRFLSSDPHIEIIGSTLTGENALQLASALKPDLVLMDLAMPGMSGLEAARQIKTLSTSIRVILLTLYDNPEYRAASQAVKADGFVSKSEFGVALLPLIHAMFQVETVEAS